MLLSSLCSRATLFITMLGVDKSLKWFCPPLHWKHAPVTTWAHRLLAWRQVNGSRGCPGEVLLFLREAAAADSQPLRWAAVGSGAGGACLLPLGRLAAGETVPHVWNLGLAGALVHLVPPKLTLCCGSHWLLGIQLWQGAGMAVAGPKQSSCLLGYPKCRQKCAVEAERPDRRIPVAASNGSRMR